MLAININDTDTNKIKKSILPSILFFIAINSAYANDIKIDYQNPQKPQVSVAISDKVLKNIIDEYLVLDKAKAQKILNVKMITDGKQAKHFLSGVLHIRLSPTKPRLVFTPTNHLNPEFSWVATYKTNSKTIDKKFRALALVVPYTTPKVQEFYPKETNIPINTKFFTFVFSVPMQKDPKMDNFIEVYEGDKEIMIGEKRPKWNADGTRLSIIIHPSGLLHGGKNTSHGKQPAFYDGKSYKITLNDKLKDIYGRKIEPYSYSFTATKRDMTKPCIIKKDIKIPTKETMQPLVLRFSEPMDYWMMTRNIKLDHLGSWTTDDDGTQWQFVPTKKWHKKTYKVDMSYFVTDLADWKLDTENSCIDKFSF